MNPKIDPEVALKKVDLFLQEIEEKNLLGKNYRAGSEDLKRIIKEIEGLLRATFSDSSKRISKYHPNYIRISGVRVDFESEYISEVKLTIDNLLSLKSELNLYIDSKNVQRVIDIKDVSKSHNVQYYFEKVENFALGDINNYNTKIYLNALIHAIEESRDIPPEEKKNLVDKIKNIVNNPYVSGIGVGLIVEAIKTGFVGK